MQSFNQLSVIIVNYQSERYLKNCLASLYNWGKSLEIEVIIVNNNLPGRIDFIGRDFPEVKIIESGKNKGFGAGVNLGAKNSNGAYLLFLNPDTEMVGGSGGKVRELFEKRPQLAVIGAQMIDQTGQTQKWFAGAEISLWNLMLNNLGLSESRKIWLSSKAQKVDWVGGSAMFIKKENFESVGGFDENFFLYFEDMDLCKRIRAKGKYIMYLPEIKVKHFSGKSFSSKENQKKEYYQAQEYYFKKNRGKLQAELLKIMRKIFI